MKGALITNFHKAISFWLIALGFIIWIEIASSRQLMLSKHGQKRNLLSSQCQFITFPESYKTKYMTSNITISPSYNMICDGQTYQRQSVSVNNGAFQFNATRQQLQLTDWSQLSNNSFYQVTLTAIIQNTNSTNDSSQYTVSGSFMFVVGTVKIQFNPISSTSVDYNKDLVLDYSSAFDPEQPISGKITITWKCPALFINCQSLGKYNFLSALRRIKTYGMMYDLDYTFNVTLQNINTGYYKQVSDSFTVTAIAPNDNQTPQSCIGVQLQFQNQLFKLVDSSQFVSQIYFQNGAYSDIVIVAPQLSLQGCSSDVQQQNQIVISQMTTTTFYSHSLYFFTNNSGSITISKEKLASSLTSGTRQLIEFYVILTDVNQTQVLGYTYKELGITVGAQTLYSYVTPASLSITSDKILYLDGSNSYDVLAPSQNAVTFNYQWSIQNYSSIVLPNTAILTLDPTQRNALGINQAGKSYNFTLQVMDSTRRSSISSSLVSIAPSINPSNCITLQMKPIDTQAIANQLSFLQYFLQQVITKVDSKCADRVKKVQLIWTCPSISYQFWEYFGNNNTIAISRDSIQMLPKSKDIPMSVIQYYSLDGIEYIAKTDFIFILQSDKLVPVIKYSTVVDLANETLTLDGSSSYDPSMTAGSNDAPIQCTWTCPIALQSICVTLSGCYQSISSAKIKAITSYQQSIQDQSHMFQFTIQKGSRLQTYYFYVTLVDGSQFPKCSINIEQDYEFNLDLYLNTTCSNFNTSQVTYQWAFYDWNTQLPISQQNSVVLNQQRIHIAPYILSQHNNVVLQVNVTNGNYTTPINMFYNINSPSNIATGTLLTNFDSYQAYLSQFILSVNGWSSEASYDVNFQIRYKIAPNYFAVLFSPAQLDAITPLNIVLPPLNYENILYVDIIDSDGNVVTQQLQIFSKVSQNLTANTFAYQVATIVNQINYAFSELSFEENILALKLAFQAYQTGFVDTTQVSADYFTTICSGTIIYFNNTFLIDKRLNDVLSTDRLRILKQEVIEILFAITYKQMYLPYSSEILNLVNYITNNGNYSLGNEFMDTSIKAIQTVITTIDSSKNTLQYAILQNIYSYMSSYMAIGEQYSKQNNGLAIYAMKVNKQTQRLFNVPNFSYSQATILNSITSEGVFIIMCDTTILYSKASNSTSSYSLGKCIRPDKPNATATTNTTSNSTNPITTPPTTNSSTNASSGAIIDTNNLNASNTQIQQSTGTWSNSSIASHSSSSNDDPNPYIYKINHALIPVGGLIIIGLFVLSAIIIYRKYSYEKYEMTMSTTFKFQPSNNATIFAQRIRLLILLLKLFNPYLNLFLIKNKYLPRWIRSIFIQLDFLLFSTLFIIIFAANSDDKNSYGGSGGSVVSMFFIALVIFVVGRPLTMRLIQLLFYEPDALVEDINPYLTNNSPAGLDGDITNKFSTPSQNKKGDTQQILGLNKQVSSFIEDSSEVLREGIIPPQDQNVNALNEQDQNIVKLNTTGEDIFDANHKDETFDAEQIRIADESFIDECLNDMQKKKGKGNDEDFVIFEGGEPEDKNNVDINPAEEQNDIDDTNDQGCYTNKRLKEKHSSPLFDDQGLFENHFKDNEAQLGENVPSTNTLYQENDYSVKDSEIITQKDKLSSKRLTIPEILHHEKLHTIDQQEIATVKYQSPDRKFNRSSPTSSPLKKLQNEVRKLYVKKIIGKGLCLILWVVLILIHIICLYHLRVHQFKNWLILSILTFVIMMVIIDPILYFMLSFLVIEKGQDQYQLDLDDIQDMKKKGMRYLYIGIFIGQAKMNDLRRAIQNDKQ